MRRQELRRCGLTDNDLFCELRLRGVFDLSNLRYVLYEAKGGLTVVPLGQEDDQLVQAGVEGSRGRPASWGPAPRASRSSAPVWLKVRTGSPSGPTEIPELNS